MRPISLAPMLALLLALVPPAEALAAAADPTRLYQAIRQIPRWDLYAGLDVGNKAAGDFYLDPTTSVRVTRITSPTVPLPNPDVSVDYAEGGPYVSGEWGTGQHTLLIRPMGAGRPWLVDYQRGVGLSNWREFPSDVDGDGIYGPLPRYGLTSSFASHPATPRILYFVDYHDQDVTQNMRLYRLNTGTDPMQLDGDADEGGFIPDEGREIPGTAGTAPYPLSFTKLDWMQSSRDDEWFVFQWCLDDATTDADRCVVMKVFALNRLIPNGTNNPIRRTCIPGDFKTFDCLDKFDANGNPNPNGLLDSSDLDEPHLDRNGDYVMLLDGTRDANPGDPYVTGPPACSGGGLGRVFDEYFWHRWDIRNDPTAATLPCKSPIYSGHPAWVRGHFVTGDPGTQEHPNFYYTPAPDPAADQVTVTAEYADPIITPGRFAHHPSHRAGQWIQAVADPTQWYWGSGTEDGEVRVPAWSPHGERFPGDVNQIFTSTVGDCNPDPGVVDLQEICWDPMYKKPQIGIRAVYQTSDGDLNRLTRVLTQVGSLDLMTPGTFFFDGTVPFPHRIHVWAHGGGDPGTYPTSRVYLFAPSPVHWGVGARRVNGTDSRLLCHNYSWPDGPDDYEETPFATTSPDGKLVMFNSNMGQRDGRTDVFVAEVPLAGGGGGGCDPRCPR